MGSDVTAVGGGWLSGGRSGPTIARGREAMATTTRFITDEELSLMPNDGVNYERVDGYLRGSAGGVLHSAVSVGLVVALGTFVERQRLGHVVGTHTGYRWPGRYPDRPDNVRCPDVSFVAAGRF